MILIHLICSNFIKFRLTTNQMLAQNVLLLCYTTLPSPLELAGGFVEPFCSDVAVPLTDRLLCSCIATA